MSKGTHNMAFITFQCYACGKALKVPADKAGRKAKCNQCGTVLTIPAQSSMAESSTGSAPPKPPAPQAPTYPTAVDTSTQVQPSVTPQEQAYEPAFVDYVQPEAAAPAGYAPAPAPGGYPPPQQPGHYMPPAPGGHMPPPQPAVYPAPTAPGAIAPAYPGAPQPADAGQEYAGDEPLDVSLKAKWGFVRLGMLLCFIGSCVMAGAYALQAIGWLVVTIPTVQMLSGGMPNLSSFESAQVLLGLAAIVGLGATLTAIVGYVFCILGPNKNGSMGLSIAATAVAVVGLLLILIVELPYIFSRNAIASRTQQGFFVTWFFLLFIQLLFIAEMILVALLIRALAMSVKKRSLAASAMMPLFLVGGYGAARLLTFVFWLVGANVSGDLAGRVMGWITLIFLWVGIFVFILYLVVNTLFLWRARDVVPMHRVERLN